MNDSNSQHRKTYRPILVTGADGFLGSSIIKALSADPDFEPVASVRSVSEKIPGSVRTFSSQILSRNHNWTEALKGADTVVHCAARAHKLNDSSKDPLKDFIEINTEGTLKLAEQAAANGVRRFIFISSIGVNGISTKGAPFSSADTPAPHSPYAVSKYKAEEGLKEIAANSDMSLVIIRPPLIYGKNAPGNFARLVKWVKKGIPLPFGSVKNKRSMVYIGNLTDMILKCIDNKDANSKTFLVSDGADISTTELLKTASAVLDTNTVLIPVPEFMLRSAASIAGKRDLAEQLLGSLQIDISDTCRTLGWSPPFSAKEALRLTFESYKNPDSPGEK